MDGWTDGWVDREGRERGVMCIVCKAVAPPACRILATISDGFDLVAHSCGLFTCECLTALGFSGVFFHVFLLLVFSSRVFFNDYIDWHG